MKQPSSLFKLNSYGITHSGKVREHNEDAFLDKPEEGLWVVADGAGGHEKGEVASQLIVSELACYQPEEDVKPSVNKVLQILQKVNQTLLDMREELTHSGLIGSTVCALLIQDKYAAVIWAGDSRVYLCRDSQLFRLTQDHNRIEEFLKAGFSESELANSRLAQQLTHAVGAVEVLPISVQLYEVMVGDLFLLCSDGVSGELSRDELARVLQASSSAQVICEVLIDCVLQGAARDNLTALLVKCE